MEILTVMLTAVVRTSFHQRLLSRTRPLSCTFDTISSSFARCASTRRSTSRGALTSNIFRPACTAQSPSTCTLFPVCASCGIAVDPCRDRGCISCGTCYLTGRSGGVSCTIGRCCEAGDTFSARVAPFSGTWCPACRFDSVYRTSGRAVYIYSRFSDTFYSNVCASDFFSNSGPCIPSSTHISQLDPCRCRSEKSRSVPAFSGRSNACGNLGIFGTSGLSGISWNSMCSSCFCCFHGRRPIGREMQERGRKTVST